MSKRPIDPQEKQRAIEIGNRLRTARLEKDYKQREMGDFIGTSYQNYGRFERGAEIRGTLLIKFCAILDCAPSWLLGIKEDGMRLPPESKLLKELKSAFELLNKEGQKKSIDFTNVLTHAEEYTKKGKKLSDTHGGGAQSVQDNPISKAVG